MRRHLRATVIFVSMLAVSVLASDSRTVKLRAATDNQSHAARTFTVRGAFGAQTCAIEASEWAPRGTARTARPRITVTLTSTCRAPIDPGSIQMTIDEETVMADAEGTGPKITVVHTPESALVEEEDHTVVVKARDAKGTAGEHTWTFHVGDTYSR